MGEYADYILNGDDCQECGQHIGEGNGYPRSCAGCGGKQAQSSGGGKRARNARKRRRRRERDRQKKELILSNLHQAGKSVGWTLHTEVHWQKTINGQKLDFWPTTKKAMWRGIVYPAIESIDDFVKGIEASNESA